MQNIQNNMYKFTTKYATNMQINMLNMKINMLKKCRICKICKIVFQYAEYVTNKMQNMLYRQNMQNNMYKICKKYVQNMLNM